MRSRTVSSHDLPRMALGGRHEAYDRKHPHHRAGAAED
jgi:hypothetical protein